MTKPIDPGYAFRSLARAVSWHRRKLAVVAAVLAVLAGINAAAPRPAETVTVLRAVEPLPAGSRAAPGQVRAVPLPADAVPEQALTDPAQMSGRIIAATVPVGQVLTEPDLVAGRSLRPGAVLAPVRLSDPGLAAVLRPGEVIDIVATDGRSGAAEIVAEAVRLVTLPELGEAAGRADAGGVLLLIETDAGTATELARAAATSTLSVIWRR